MVSIKAICNHMLGLIGFLYRVFIFVQMCCLGYGESIRLKKFFNFLVINSRQLKINQQIQ